MRRAILAAILMILAWWLVDIEQDSRAVWHVTAPWIEVVYVDDTLWLYAGEQLVTRWQWQEPPPPRPTPTPRPAPVQSA